MRIQAQIRSNQSNSVFLLYREMMEAAGSFINSVTYTLFGRRFCVTKKGFVGLVLADTKIGNEIAIINGATVLFVLRYAGTGDISFYLIGECHVLCIMRGEALAEPSVRRQDIRLR